MNGPVVKTAAAQHAFVRGSSVGRPVAWNIRDVGREGVLAPFPDVSGHVVEAKLIGGFLRHGLSVVAMPAVVPRDGLDVVAAAEAEAAGPMRAPTSGIFPFG